MGATRGKKEKSKSNSTAPFFALPHCFAIESEKIEQNDTLPHKHSPSLLPTPSTPSFLLYVCYIRFIYMFYD